MADTTDLERAIAAFVLGGLSPGDEARVLERLQKDLAARRLEQQMRQTLGALGTWQEAHEALPRPAIPSVRRSPMRLILPLAAAAAVLIAAGVWLLAPKTPAPDLSSELAWTSTRVSLPKEMWAYEPAAPRPAEGGPRTGGPGDRRCPTPGHRIGRPQDRGPTQGRGRDGSCRGRRGLPARPRRVRPPVRFRLPGAGDAPRRFETHAGLPRREEPPQDHLRDRPTDRPGVPGGFPRT
jgi:hypothetical protein